MQIFCYTQKYFLRSEISDIRENFLVSENRNFWYQNLTFDIKQAHVWDPLGRPRSVYKNNVECRFLSQNGQMTLKVKVNDLHF